ncbi:hypothetical protein QBC44DRAFT_253953 [Cladorrhinum sp. PSN332]|nr:hypothetical protein QBC44DRAFT_253953 [Cladorrhinum sp. PSN332]
MDPNQPYLSEDGVVIYAEDLSPNDYSLFPEGDNAKFHTQNDPNNIFQRTTIIERKGRIHVRCEHKDIAHGYYSTDDDQLCTLLVVQFRFDPNGVARRIKEAHIKMTFSALERGAVDPEVIAMYPEGSFSVEPTTQHETCVNGGGVSIGGGIAGIEASAELQLQRTIERDTSDATRIRASMDIHGRNWGGKNGVSWDLWENGTAKTGVVTSMQAAILLKRRDMRQFKSTVTIKVAADTLTTMESIFKTNPRDDDVFYNPDRQPPSTDRLQKYDVENLGLEDLKSLSTVECNSSHAQLLTSICCFSVVAIHGLNGRSDTWHSDPEKAKDLITHLFGDRSPAVRFSTYFYNLITDVLVVSNFQKWALKLLESLKGLRADDGHAVNLAAFDFSTFRDIATSTKALIFLGGFHTICVDTIMQNSLKRLLVQAAEADPNHEQLGHFLSLSHAVSHINFRFHQAYTHLRFGLLCLFSFDSPKSHLSLPYCTDSLQKFRPEIEEYLAPRFAATSPVLQAVSRLGHPIRVDLPAGFEYVKDFQDFNPPAGTDIFQRWTALPRSIGTRAQIYIAAECDAELFCVLLRNSFEGTAVAASMFNFRPWDSRCNTLESFFSDFLSSVIRDFDFPVFDHSDNHPLPESYGFDERWMWSCESLFFCVYDALLRISQKRYSMVWILANLNDEVAHYEWFIDKLDTLKADSDISLHVIIVNQGPCPPQKLPGVSVVEISERWSNAFSGAFDTFENTNTRSPDHQPLSTIDSVISPPPLRIVQFILDFPAYYPLSKLLSQLWKEYQHNEAMKPVLLDWLRREARPAPPVTELEHKILQLLPASADTAFKYFLSKLASIDSPTRTAPAMWALDLAQYAFRPLSIYQLQDLNNVPKPKSFPQIPFLLCRPGLESNPFEAFVVINHEFRLGNPQFRRFLVSQREDIPSAFASNNRASIAHSRIANACLEYLLSCEMGMSRPFVRDVEAVPVFDSSVNFLPYAVKYWPDHVRLAGEHFEEDNSLLRRLIQHPDILDIWARMYWSLSNPVTRPIGPMTPLGLLTLLGLDSTFQAAGLDVQPLSDLERLDILEHGARTSDHVLVRKLTSQSAVEGGSPLRVILASMEGQNEHLTLEILEWALKAPGIRTSVELTVALQRAAFWGLTDVMHVLIANVDLTDGTAILSSACIGGHVAAVELIFDTMLKLKQPITVPITNGNQEPAISIPAIETACEHGQSKVVEFFVLRHPALIFDDPALFNKLLKLATASRQARILEMLLSGAAGQLEWPAGYSETVLQCFEQAVSHAMVRCCEAIFAHLASVLPTKERNDLACRHLTVAAETGDVEIVRCVLSMVKEEELDVEMLSSFWEAIIAKPHGKTEYGMELVRKIAGQCLKVWSQDDRAKYLGLAARAGAMGDGGGINLLSLCLELGTEIVNVLLEAGVDVNWKDPQGKTALFMAIEDNSVDIAYKLLEHPLCPELNIVIKRETELSLAVKHQQSNLVAMLLSTGANPSVPHASYLRDGLLHWCVQESLRDILASLLLCGVWINGLDRDGCLPLHRISDKTTVEIVKLLVNRGAKVNETSISDNEYTPLHQAVLCDNYGVAKYLIKDAGANIDAIGTHGSPLHVACWNVSLDMVKLLVENGANVNSGGHKAAESPFQSVCLSFRARSETRSKDPVLRYLLQCDSFDINAESPLWGPNLNVACLASGLDIVSDMIARGAQVNREDRMGRQPIHFATFQGVPYLESLLRAGASLDSVDMMKRSILHVAVVGGKLSVVKYITGCRPYLVHEKDIDGWTPLMWAMLDYGTPLGQSEPPSEQERVGIIQALLDCGASRLIRGEGLDRDWTAFRLAHYCGVSDEIVELVTPTTKDLNSESLDAAERDLWGYNLDPENPRHRRKARRWEGKQLRCDACLSALFGIYYTCDIDESFHLCFKCYGSKAIIHPDHAFNATYRWEEYEDGWNRDLGEFRGASEPSNESAGSNALSNASASVAESESSDGKADTESNRSEGEHETDTESNRSEGEHETDDDDY